MNQLATDSLLWIKGELDGVLLRARQELEAYVENPDERDALGRCLESLHQIQGTLRIVEVHGAALLAEEMEAVAKGIYAGSLDASDEAFEVLMRAILQLPDYLERVMQGQRDMPLALLSLLNDLRGVRGEPLLSEGSLFASTMDDRSVQLPSLPSESATRTADIGTLAKKLRPKFQNALLAWFKNEESHKPLERMAAIVGKFEQAAGRPAVFELWWLVGGVLEALTDDGLSPSVAVKQMLGQIDRQIKRLARESEAEFANEPPRELINNLLYYVGRARSDGKRVANIKESFNLTELLPDEAQIDETRAALSGPNAQLMRTVSAAIKEDIVQVKDSLDIFVRTGRQNPEDLAPLAELLKKVGDTLAVLGLGTLRAGLGDEMQTLQAVASGERSADEAPLMAVAESLLALETRLDDDMSELVRGDAKQSAAARESEDGGDSEYKNTFSAVIRESIINLARVKEAITEYSRGESDARIASPVPDHIRQVQVGLGLLDMERPSSVLDGIRRFVEQQVLPEGARPSADLLDRMADALVSIEFYLETVQSGRGDPQSMLDNAETCVAQLGVADDDGAPSLSVVEAGSEASGESAPEAESKPEPASQPAPPEAAEPPAPAAAVAGPAPDEVDPEILEIFLEEAHEELARLRDYFPRWRSNMEDREALTVVRRSFHTLKGSGRMVGARRIGEFAWAVENMLNRVIDGTVEAGEPIVELVAEVLETLPRLVEELEHGSAPATDIDQLVRRAEAFSRNERPPEPVSTEEALEPEPEPETGAASIDDGASDTGDADAGTAMDPTLYDIFSKESATHLGIVDEFIDECEQGSAAPPGDAVLRALHTLKGSAHIAGADTVADLAEATEHFLKVAAERHEHLQPPATDTLHKTVAAIKALIEGLAEPGGASRDFSELFQELASLAETEPESGDVAAAAEPGAEEPVSDLADEESATSDVDALTETNVAFPPEEDNSEPAHREESAEAAAREPEAESEPVSVDAAPAGESADFDPELAAIFFEEARELIESIDVAMQDWSDTPQDASTVAELQRYLHTFKGGARMAGLMPLGDLSHELETLLTRVVDGRLDGSESLRKVVQQVVDRLHQMLESSIAGVAPQPARDLLKKLARLERGEAADDASGEAGDAPSEQPDRAVASEPAEPAASEPSEKTDQTIAFQLSRDTTARTGGSRIQPEMMRVRADLLESALNHAGEVGIYRSRLEQHNSTMNFNVTEFETTVARLRDQLRKFEIETEAQIGFQHEQDRGAQPTGFDPLELDRYSQMQQLSRSLMESVGDLVSIYSLLSNQTREAETLLLQQSRVTTELQDSLMRTRMVPFSRHAQRLRRVVRQAAEESGKEAQLKLVGAEGEMDRQVLERVLGPLEHMLRNSVVHGIETPADREKVNKAQGGQIKIAMHREGAEVVLNISDDGAGLDIEAIRKQAVARGLLKADAELPENEIMQFIFEPGFSTAKKVTKSAGRGVGMDVVASEVKQLGGALTIDSERGLGTTFTARLPFTLAITQALIVTASDQTYAIPLPAIEGIARIPGRDLNRFFAGELKEFTYGGRAYRLHHLSSLLDFSVPEAEEGRTSYPVLLVHSGDHYGALVMESMQGSREVVVKSIGPQLASIRGLSGATILGDGSILLILDPTALIRSAHGRLLETTIIEHPVATVDNRKVVMVVDDSITVRRVTRRLLERYDMRVETAKDGVDALTQLQDIKPDVMLLDIEMPRMDGYEVASNIRNDKRLRDMPIIMITSRTGEKHRNRAMDLGVDEYLGKPYQESDLLEHIQRLIETAGTAA